MIKRLQTLLIVTLVAAMVWVFAESESLREQRFGATLVLSPEEGSALHIGAAQTGAREVSAELLLEAPAGALDAVRRALAQPLTISPGAPGVPSTEGEFALDLREVLRNNAALLKSGASVQRVDPPTLTIRIEELVPVEVGVQVVGEGEFQGAPVATPPRVRVLAPRGDALMLSASSTSIARIDAASLERLVPGRQEVIPGVRLAAPEELTGAKRVRIAPPTVDVTLTLRSSTAEVIVPRVPVHVRLAPQELSQWDIHVAERDRFLIDVRVTGPAEVLRRIEDRSLTLVAEVALSFEELENGVTSKEAVFSNLPTSLKFDVANRVVHFDVKRRNAGQ
jgi:hypothetical protein